MRGERLWAAGVVLLLLSGAAGEEFIQALLAAALIAPILGFFCTSFAEHYLIRF